MNDAVVKIYEDTVEKPDTGELGKLSILCQEMLTQERFVAQIEEELSAAKKVLLDYKASKIPALMQELRLNQLTMASGVVIALQRVINCRFRPTEKMHAFEWLEQHNLGSMIKHELEVEFGRGEGDLANKAVEILTELGLRPSVSKDVHFQTLSAWARREVEAGNEVPATFFDLTILNLVKVK